MYEAWLSRGEVVFLETPASETRRIDLARLSDMELTELSEKVENEIAARATNI